MSAQIELTKSERMRHKIPGKNRKSRRQTCIPTVSIS